MVKVLGGAGRFLGVDGNLAAGKLLKKAVDIVISMQNEASLKWGPSRTGGLPASPSFTLPYDFSKKTTRFWTWGELRCLGVACGSRRKRAEGQNFGECPLKAL
jgi:hypothetical protein